MSQRLPVPGSDNGTWGDILNTYLGVSHASDGTLNSNVVGTAQLQSGCVTNAQLDTPTQTILASVASKYVKPSGGIPSTDLSSGVQTSLASANSSVQSVNSKAPVSGNVTLKVADLNDATAASGATNNQVLSYNSGTSQWVPATVSSTTVSDATTSSKGIVELAGDLGGTATAPTVPKASGLRSATTAIDVSAATAPSSGQVLTASSGTAAAWQTPAAGFADPTTTKGDIIVHGTSSTTKEAVGSDGQVLTADSTQGTGIKWATPPSAPVSSVAGKTGAVTLATTDLTDTNIATPTNNQVLTYNTSSSKWVNQTPASGVALDSTATDIQPDTTSGTAVAGATGKAADAGHQHPLVAHDHSTTNKGGQITPTTGLAATGTASSVTFLRGDNSWTSPPTASNATTSTPGLVQLAGDLGGTATSPSVAKVNGIAVSGTPSANQALIASSSTAAAWSTLPSAPVTSVLGRTGVVTAQSGDYSFSQVGAAQGLMPTAVKTSAYTAAAGDFVPVDASSASVTVTLPTAPADQTRIGVKLISVSGSNSLTISRGGSSDVFNKAGGSTSLTLSALFQGALLQYASSPGIWYVTAMESPLNVASGAAQLGTDGKVGGPGGSPLSSSIGSGITDRGAWLATHAYVIGDSFTINGLRYYVTTAYTSGSSFGSTDTTNTIILGSQGSSLQSFNNLSDVGSVRTARDNLNAGPRGVVVKPEDYGAKGDVVMFTDGAMTAGSSTLTSSAFTTGSLPGGSGSKNVYVGWAGAGTSGGTTSGTVTAGTITTFNRAASGPLIPAGPILVGGVLFATTGVAANATVVTVLSQVIASSIASGSAITYGNAGLSTTVSSVATGSATLGATATSTVTGIVGWYGTDDSAAFRSAMTALTNGGTLLHDAKGYLLDSAPQTTLSGNAVVGLPWGTLSPLIELRGTAGSTVGEVVGITNGAAGGTQLFTTRLSDTYSSSNGAPALIGGPTDEQLGGTGSTRAGTILANNLEFVLPENPAIGGLYLKRNTSMHLRNVRIKTAGQMPVYGGYGFIGQVPSHNHSFGVWAPGFLNDNSVTFDDVGVLGVTAPIIIAEHATLLNAYAQFCKGSLCFSDGSGGHLNRIVKMGIFDCNYGPSGWDPQNGIRSLNAGSQAYVEGTLNWENGVGQWGITSHVLDANNAIIGRFTSHNQTFVGTDDNWDIVGGAYLIIKPVSPRVIPTSYDDVVLADSPTVYAPLGNAGPLLGGALSSALSTGSPTSSLTVSALSQPIAPGIIIVNSAGNYQQWITTGAAAAATSIPVASQTPNFAYPIGSLVTPQFQVPDLSGNGHSGIAVGRQVSGLSGPQGTDRSLQFVSASSQFVLLDTLGTIGASIGTATFETWVKMPAVTTGGQQCMFGTANNTTGTQFYVTLNTNNAGTAAAGDTAITLYDQAGAHHRVAHITALPYDGNWHLLQIQPSTTGTHLVWVDGSSVTVTMEGTPGTLVTLANFGSPMTLGAWNNTGFFGILRFADVRLAKFAVYPSQLAASRLVLRYQTALFRN